MIQYIFTICLLLASFTDAQTFCQRGKGPILDTGAQCLRSVDYDVANCCYVCPVQNATSLYLMCGSLYDLGFAACGQAGALAARQAACTAMGGDITAGAFTCQCNSGVNQSQINYVSLAPTTGTGAPTNGGDTSPTAPMLMFFTVFVLYALHH